MSARLLACSLAPARILRFWSLAASSWGVFTTSDPLERPPSDSREVTCRNLASNKAGFVGCELLGMVGPPWLCAYCPALNGGVSQVIWRIFIK